MLVFTCDACESVDLHTMFLPPVLAQSAFTLPKKNQNPLAQINAFEAFGFRCIVTGPSQRGRSEEMQLSSIRPVLSDGVVQNFNATFSSSFENGLVVTDDNEAPQFHAILFESRDLLILLADRSDFDVRGALEDEKVKKL